MDHVFQHDSERGVRHAVHDLRDVLVGRSHPANSDLIAWRAQNHNLYARCLVDRFLFVLIPVSLAYVSLMNYFRATQRELKRLESITRSPIFAHFSQTLGGLSTIRCVSTPDHWLAMLKTQRI
jgi:hypothetical protein